MKSIQMDLLHVEFLLQMSSNLIQTHQEFSKIKQELKDQIIMF